MRPSHRGPAERSRRPKQVHWIQARLARDDIDAAEQGRIVRLDGDLLTVRVADELRHYQVHDSEWVAWLIERQGRRVLVQERWSLLRLNKTLIGIAPAR